MVLTFADTHNMIIFLTKLDASEGFDQIIDFLNASDIKYALTVNPNIYVSVIKKFWSSVVVKKVNDVTRLQALVDRKKCMIAKRTAWNEFSSSMALAVICLSIGKGFYGVETPLFEGMIVAQQAVDVADKGAAGVNVDDVPATSVNINDVPAADAEPTIPSPPPTQSPPPLQEQEQPFTSQRVKHLDQDEVAQALKITKLKQRVKNLERKNKLRVSRLMRLKKVGTAQRVESSEDIVMDDVSKQGEIIANIDADEDVTLKDVAAVEKDAEVLSMQDDEPEPAELKEGVEIRDPKETATPSTIIHSEPKSKDKGKGIMVYEPKNLKKQAQIEQDEAYARELKNMAGFKLDYFKGMSYDAIRPIFEKYFNSNVAFLEKSKAQLEEEESRALKRKAESSEEKATKKQKLDEEVKELRKHLYIVPNNDDDVYTEATPLALKPKNFSDDFLLTTLGAMFEKPDVQAQIWKSQRIVHGLAKVKSWKVLESCGVQIITLTTTQLILLVERKYLLTRFTLDQILNNVRLEVEEESEASLELLRFVRQQHQEGYSLE
nr:hypothetical protein [Tanacetum cinerariifolium]